MRYFQYLLLFLTAPPLLVAADPWPNRQGKLVCSPSKLYRSEILELKMSVPHGSYLVIRAPIRIYVHNKTTPFFVVFPFDREGKSFMPSSKFINIKELKLNTKTLKAQPWVANRKPELVFTKPGNYEIVVGDHIETDGPSYVSCHVEFVDRERPEN